MGKSRAEALLRSIISAQSQFADERDSKTIFEGLLEALLSATDSEYGFIGEVLRDNEGKPFLQTRAITNIAWNDETRDFYDEQAPTGLRFDNLETLFGRVMTSGQPVIANSPGTDPRRGGLPVGHPPLVAFLGLPFSHQGEMNGMVGIANRAAGYDQALIEFIGPLVRTCANTIAMFHAEATEKESQHALHAALGEVRELKNRLEKENTYLRWEVRQQGLFGDVVSEDPAMLALIDDVRRVAPTDTSVLIQGETGTGKELIARAIHELSNRGKAMVRVNCGAIPDNLVESELFGHEKGAFTGATQKRQGRFELAGGTTLFLDEVSELPLSTQVKLLRVLQEGEFEPVGSDRTRKVDVRVIAASNRDLEKAVEKGEFRSDLFYRLNVFPLRLPPLRDRRSDIPLLLHYFLTSRFRKLGKTVEGFDDEALACLQQYDWPGNVRELQNVVERALIRATGTKIQMRDLGMPAGAVAPDKLEDVERQHIQRVLGRTGWTIGGPRGAATALGMNDSTLRSRMKKLGVTRSD